jgi:hypothetical protein
LGATLALHPIDIEYYLRRCGFQVARRYCADVTVCTACPRQQEGAGNDRKRRKKHADEKQQFSHTTLLVPASAATVCPDRIG